MKQKRVTSIYSNLPNFRNFPYSNFDSEKQGTTKKVFTSVFFLFFIFFIYFFTILFVLEKTLHSQESTEQTSPDQENSINGQEPDSPEPEDKTGKNDTNNIQKRIDLNEYLKKILIDNPEIQEAQKKVDFYRGYYEEAQGSRYPKITFLGIVAPTPAFEGDSQKSKINWRKWGPFLRGQVDLQMPLYTFGRIPHAKKAAEEAMRSEEFVVEQVKSKVILRSKEFFYGYLLAYSAMNNVLLFAEEKLNEAIDYAEEQYDLGTGMVSKADLGRLKVGLAELSRRKAEAEKYLKLTRSALARFLGYSDPDDFPIAQKEIEVETIELQNLEYYTNRGFEKNAQWNQLKKGIQARKSYLDFEKSFRLPILFWGARLAGSYSYHIDNQDSVFANDPFNELLAGVFVGIKWELNFSRKGIIRRAQSEYEQLISKEKFAKDGIYLLIQKAYEEVVETKKKVDSDYKGYRSALSWLSFSFIAFQSGTGEARDALEGLAATALYHYNYYESVFQYNMALAHLSQMVGEEITQLNY